MGVVKQTGAEIVVSLRGMTRTNGFARRSHMIVDATSRQAGTEHARFSSDEACGAQARNAVMWSASCMKNDRHPAWIVRSEVY